MSTNRLASILSIILAVGSFSATAQTPDAEWKSGKFHNLIIGKSTSDEVRSELGKPAFVGKEEDTGVPLITYEIQEPFPGFLYVYIRNKKLVGLTLGLKTSVDREEIVRLFGSGYRIVNYDFDDCLATGGSAPVYQSPNGPIEDMEYPGIGVSVRLHNGKAQEIAFTNHPAGPTHSRCAP
jgi:hypothetical protein